MGERRVPKTREREMGERRVPVCHELPCTYLNGISVTVRRSSLVLGRQRGDQDVFNLRNSSKR